MDSITQAVLGGTIGEAILGKKLGNKGAVLGAIVATIPDLDILLHLFFDKFEMLSIHRGYSHSIVFSILGAFFIAFIMSRFKWSEDVSYRRFWIFSWLALFTHILLDAFTAYGTQLFLPFSDQRVGLDSINVVDPVYTLPLLTGLIASLFVYKKKPGKQIYNYLGITISTLYLLGTLGIKNHVIHYFQQELTEQNISSRSLLTMPVGVASINWYGVAKTDKGIYMHKYSILNDEQLAFEYFPINAHLLDEIDPAMAEQMRWFAKGFYTVEKVEERIRIYNLQVDMRGILKKRDYKAPTLGYFEFIPIGNGEFMFSSGSHKRE